MGGVRGVGERKCADCPVSVFSWLYDGTIGKLDDRRLPGLSPTVWLGALGLSGLTAYWGLVAACELKQSDTLIISGAAG